MHVLMLSLDSALVTEGDGASRRRHLEYAERAGRLTAIVYTPPGAGEALALSPQLTVIPTNSRSRYLFPLDAYRLGAQVVRQTPVDLIVAQDPFTTGLAGLWLRGRFRVPLLAQNHAYFFGNESWLAERRINRLFDLLGRYVVRRVDMYRTVNRKEHDNYLNIGGSPERVVTLPLAVASEAFAAPVPDEAIRAKRATLGLEVHHKVAIWVGYPVKFKRVPVLLDVFRRVARQDPDARLLLVGDMAVSAVDLRALAGNLGIADKVIFAGRVDHAELPTYYALANVYVHTSAYEGVPRVLMEAAAAGLPLVAMDCVGVNEVIEDGVNGCLLPDLDAEGMAAQIAALFRDPTKARALGETARRLTLERYNAADYAARWVGVWEQAIRLGLRPKTRPKTAKASNNLF